MAQWYVPEPFKCCGHRYLISQATVLPARRAKEPLSKSVWLLRANKITVTLLGLREDAQGPCLGLPAAAKQGCNDFSG